jgi:hypothetical protein
MSLLERSWCPCTYPQQMPSGGAWKVQHFSRSAHAFGNITESHLHHANGVVRQTELQCRLGFAGLVESWRERLRHCVA